MMSSCVVYASCLISSCLFVMPLIFTCSIDIPVARDVLFGLCGVFLSVGANILLFACVGDECCVGVAVWFKACALAPAQEKLYISELEKLYLSDHCHRRICENEVLSSLSISILRSILNFICDTQLFISDNLY